MTPARQEPPATVRRVDQLLAHYGQSHLHPVNELIHFFAIPLIMLSLLGLLFALDPAAAYLFVAASMVYYARLSLVFLLAMLGVSALMLGLVHAMGDARLMLSIGIFAVAWVFQFIGHTLEGKRPSFLEDIQYLWVGPLFVLSKLFKQLGIRW